MKPTMKADVVADRNKTSLIVAGVLQTLIGLAATIGAVGLYRGGPDAAPDIVASVSATQAVAAGMLVGGAVLIAAGVMAFLRRRIAWTLGVAALIAFVILGFVFNFMLFGSVRLAHSGTNVVVAVLAVWLLHKGRKSLGPAG